MTGTSLLNNLHCYVRGLDRNWSALITWCIWPCLVRKPGQDHNLGVGILQRFLEHRSPREKGEGKIVQKGWCRNKSWSCSQCAHRLSNPYLQWRFVLAYSMLHMLLWITITFCDNNKCVTLGWDIVNNENFFHSNCLMIVSLNGIYKIFTLEWITVWSF